MAKQEERLLTVPVSPLVTVRDSDARLLDIPSPLVPSLPRRIPVTKRREPRGSRLLGVSGVVNRSQWKGVLPPLGFTPKGRDVFLSTVLTTPGLHLTSRPGPTTVSRPRTRGTGSGFV